MEGKLTGHLRHLGGDRWEMVANLPRRPGEERGKRTTDRITAKGVRRAKDKLDKWLALLSQHECTDPERLTMGEVLRRWLDWQRGRALREGKPGPKTLERYEEQVSGHLLCEVDERHHVQGISDWLACEVDDERLWEFYNAKLKDGRLGGGVLSLQTVRHLHAIIHAAGESAVERGMLDKNPADAVKHPPDPRKSRSRLPVWTFEDVARAVDEAKYSQVRVPCALGGWAGLRRSEVCAQAWADVDFKHSMLYVTASVEQTKSEEGPVLTFGEVKTVKAKRRVPLVAQLRTLLEAHKKADDEKRLQMGPGWNERGLVCCRLDGRPMNPDSLTSAWAQFVKQHKLTRIEFKGLRRSWISRLHAGGAPDHLIMDWAGHEDIRTTHSHYLETMNETEREYLRWQEEQMEVASRAQTCQRSASAVVSLAEERERRRR